MSETLLFADDSVTMRRVVELTFAEQGLKVVTVSDGQQAIDYIRTHRPSLALISASLQKVNGFDVSRFVRDHVQTRMPVLLLAGAFDTLDETQVRESGAAGVLVKPFEPSVVIKRVKELLGIKPAAEAAAVPPPSGSGRFVTSPDGPTRVADASRPQSGSHTAAPPAGDERTTAAPEGVDYFNQLDAAFESLDAQLGKRTTPVGHAIEAAAAASVSEPAPVQESPSLPTAFAELNAALAHESSSTSVRPPLTDARDDTPADDRSWAPAFARADQPESFGETSPAFARADQPESFGETSPAFARSEQSAGFTETPPLSVRPHTPASSGETGTSGFAPADAFAMLWAQEQGEPIPPVPPPPPMELSEETVETLTSQLADRVAARVSAPLADRLTEDLTARLTMRLADRVTGGVADAVVRQVPGPVSAAVGDRVASEVSERVNSGITELGPRVVDGVADRIAPQIADRVIAELGDRLANGLAERIAERALQSALGDELRRTVSEVAERVVRAEIERIRAAAQQLRPQ